MKKKSEVNSKDASSWFSKYLIPLLGTGGIGVIIVALIMVHYSKPNTKIISENNSPKGKGASVVTYGNNSPAFSAITYGSNSPITQSVTYEQSPLPPQDTKKDLRALFAMMNPEIIQMIDAGTNEIHAMIGTVGQVKLADLTQRSDFKQYLSLKQTNNSLNGNSNHIGDFINDIGEDGWETGFILYPTEALKK